MVNGSFEKWILRFAFVGLTTFVVAWGKDIKADVKENEDNIRGVEQVNAAQNVVDAVRNEQYQEIIRRLEEINDNVRELQGRPPMVYSRPKGQAVPPALETRPDHYRSPLTQ